MAQGPNESNIAFAARLSAAFETWQRAGSARAVLQQALGYVANPANVQPGVVPIGAVVHNAGNGSYTTWDVAYNNSTLSTSAAFTGSGVPLHFRTAMNWNWDGVFTNWWRAWLILYFPIVQSSTTGTAASISAWSGGFATVTGLSNIPASGTNQFL